MKNILLIMLFAISLFSGCKKDEPAERVIKIETTGTNYEVKVLSSSKANSPAYLLETGVSGAKTFTITVQEEVVVYFYTTTSSNIKIYVNGSKVHDINRGAGSWAQSV